MENQKQKILVLTSTYPRWAGDTEPAFVEQLCLELHQAFDVHVLAPACASSANAETLNSIAVHRFRYAPSSLEQLAYHGGILENLKRKTWLYLLVPLFFIGQSLAIIRLHKRYQFSAVHAHWIIPQGIIAALLKVALFPKMPLLLTSHGADLFALRGSIMTRLKVWVLSKADHVTVVSRVMRNYCLDKGIPASKVTVNPMGVDLKDRFTPNNDAANKPVDVIFVGRLVEKKGVSVLIDALTEVAKHRPELVAQIIGDGPERADLEALVRKNDLQENVHFTGAVPNDLVPGYLRQAKISVTPSVIAQSGDQEGLGLVLVEALGCGCAVIASSLEAIEDVVSCGKTGLLFPPGDHVALGNNILDLLEDDLLRKDLAQQGRTFVCGRFDWSAVGHAYVKHIRDISTQSNR